MNAGLLYSTVRAATLASLGVAQTGLVTAEVRTGVRAPKTCFWRIGKVGSALCFSGIGATTIAEVVGFARPGG